MPSRTRLTLAVSLLASAAAGAQQPPPGPPPQMAPAYGPPISLAQAKKIARVAEAAARRAGAKGDVIAIVQPDGSLVYFEKLDGATYASIEFAQAKARTAAVLRMPSGPGPDNGPPPLPDLIGLPGGLPIVIGGKTVGAIGVSGTEGAAPGVNDVVIAKAGLAALE
jgi:glc operon protein GlcG